ncbi:hypothetical protein E2P47_02640, partial [Candidatus Bathyarchaeota archaeon]
WIHAAHLFFEGEKMSKRKGNIKYPQDLLETDCIWNHIRFFFIYGHYRQKLDFAFKKYNCICELLKSFRLLVKKLESNTNNEIKSSIKVKKLVAQLSTDFEEHMNNDLHVKEAFNSLYKNVESLVALKETHKLSNEDSREAIKKLKSIDYVLQTLF